MDVRHVEGRNRGNIMLYALSTCVWCKKTKRLLNGLNVAYDYVDVDLADEDERAKIKEIVLRWNSSGSYPTIVVDDRESIVGYDPERIKEVLGNGQ
jgi:glutaredoxin-like protein NrdH